MLTWHTNYTKLSTIRKFPAIRYLLRMAEITSGSSFELNTTQQNRKWGKFKSSREWKWPQEENADPKELKSGTYLSRKLRDKAHSHALSSKKEKRARQHWKVKPRILVAGILPPIRLWNGIMWMHATKGEAKKQQIVSLEQLVQCVG